ncbi:hypothetical protein [Labrys neptuniae]
MIPTFDYDLEEMVSFEGHDISLKDAVTRYRQDKAHADPSTVFTAVRDPGKMPQVLEAEHLEALLALPEFANAD